MMPEGAADVRGKQMEALEGIAHDKSTDPELGAILAQLTSAEPAATEFNEFERANIKLAQRAYDRDTKVPKDLAQRIAALTTRGHGVWVEAREKNDFASFAPVLEEWVGLVKEKSRFIDPSKDAYEVPSHGRLDRFSNGRALLIS
jgi:carboxypeptidase Taq